MLVKFPASTKYTSLLPLFFLPTLFTIFFLLFISVGVSTGNLQNKDNGGVSRKVRMFDAIASMTEEMTEESLKKRLDYERRRSVFEKRHQHPFLRTSACYKMQR